MKISFQVFTRQKCSSLFSFESSILRAFFQRSAYLTSCETCTTLKKRPELKMLVPELKMLVLDFPRVSFLDTSDDNSRFEKLPCLLIKFVQLLFKTTSNIVLSLA